MEIHITDDFNLDRIADSGQCFRWRKDDSGAYRIIHKGHCLKIRPLGNAMFRLSCSEDEYREIWHDYFDFGENYRSVRERVSREEDSFLADACEYGKGIRILRQDPWEMLVSFIISQNNNIPRIRKNIEALCDRYGERINDDFAAFPSPEALASAKEEDIAELKLGYRSRYIIESSKQYLNDGPPSTREGLLSFCGIGPKVADCIMLFGLHQVAAFPIDTWVKHIMNDMYGFDEKDVKGMQRFADERYGDLAGYAQQYLFYYYRDRS